MIAVGVDTHKQWHVAVALCALGRLLGEITVPATAAGYHELVSWLAGLGGEVVVGIEGTGSYGAGLCQYLLAAGVSVVEVERPHRRDRRAGKSDSLDALLATRHARRRRRFDAASEWQPLRFGRAARRLPVLRFGAHAAAQSAAGPARDGATGAARADRPGQGDSHSPQPWPTITLAHHLLLARRPISHAGVAPIPRPARPGPEQLVALARPMGADCRPARRRPCR